MLSNLSQNLVQKISFSGCTLVNPVSFVVEASQKKTEKRCAQIFVEKCKIEKDRTQSVLHPPLEVLVLVRACTCIGQKYLYW